MKINDRQKKILQIIVDEYTKTAQPVSSNEIIKFYLKDLSSATIRNEMLFLEKNGLVEKTHTSSGRVPSISGYKFYETHILKAKLSPNIKQQLQKIFSQRQLSIDTIVNESVSIINETLKLPSVVSTTQSNDLLKWFELVEINSKTALILMVTSSGTINKNTINLNNIKQISDIRTCIRILNDRLIDTPIRDVEKKMMIIKEIIREKVHEYEFCIRQVIEKIFDFNRNLIETNVYGTKYLTSQPEFRDVDKLKKVLNMLEDSSVWKHISYTQQKTGKTLITFGSEVGGKDVSIASTSIETKGGKHQLSIVGPTRMNYSEVTGLLEFIKNEIEKIDSRK